MPFGSGGGRPVEGSPGPGGEPALGEVEATLQRALEARAVAAAHRSGAPTADERAALARMAAHMERTRPTAAEAKAVFAPDGALAASRAPGGAPRRGPRWPVLLAPLAAAAALALWLGPRWAGEAPAADDVYLGDAGPPAQALAPFPGRVVWDDGGDGGLVRVRVLDLDAERRVWLERETTATTFEHAGPLPARFEVVVDRPSDDGLAREVLLCASYAAP